ncbi:P-type conjugative transfer protein TrbL [Hyphomicrobium sp. CS1BSMeth3]|uniref:P-type conjugative transfer protein TrbL n=1 Tax=Hyphomicrobium sp. CS1BSMeth3 TaxID=1892844 RepID=UPI0009315686|nr:P-type conjugative transfer protein TrbL [Hyphomicrobium sp. CS1BSMeth3]
MDDLAIIDRFTETFSRYIDSGFGLLAGDVAFLTTVLVTIDITLAGLFWVLMGEDNVPAQLIKKVLYVGFFALLLNNFRGLADIIFQSFAGLGLKASGASLTAADLMRPGFVASTGFTASKPLLEKAGELIGFTTFFSNFVTIAVLMLAWLIVLLAFFVLSVQLFIAIIEFKLTVLAGFVLVPFALFGATAFLAERVLGNVISSGIKLMVLAIVVGIGATLFGELIRPTGEITLTQAASCILAAIAVFGLAIFVPALASGLISGAPQLGAGAAVATAVGLGGTAVAGTMATTGAARLAGRAAGGSVKAAAALSGRVGAAYETAGMSGIARTTITAPAARMGQTATAPVRDAYRQGAAQGYRDTGASAPSDGGPPSSSPSGPPAWAQSLARRQTMTQAGMMAAQALRAGDQSAAGGAPDLKPKS